MLQPASSLLSARAATRPGATLSGGPALALVGYLLLWFVLLPFTCWGRVADPGHPHRHSHLVFVHLPDEEPTLPLTETGPLPGANASLHSPIRGVVTQAIPTILLGLAVWLILHGSRTDLPRLVRSTDPVFDFLDGRVPYLSVPTPPPRPA